MSAGVSDVVVGKLEAVVVVELWELYQCKANLGGDGGGGWMTWRGVATVTNLPNPITVPTLNPCRNFLFINAYKIGFMLELDAAKN